MWYDYVAVLSSVAFDAKAGTADTETKDFMQQRII